MEKEYTISACDNKSADWKVITLEIVEGEGSVMYENVSVNRVNKKGETFPNFDNIIVGQRVKGNLWTSPQGKHYLYAPHPQTNAGGASVRPQGGFKAGIKEAQETKRKDIETAQENRERGIMLSSTIRMATDIVVATIKDEAIIDESVIKGKILEWRRWLAVHWNDQDLPF